MNSSLVRKLIGVGLTTTGLILLLFALAGPTFSYEGVRNMMLLGGGCCVLGVLFLAFEFFTKNG